MSHLHVIPGITPRRILMPLRPTPELVIVPTTDPERTAWVARVSRAAETAEVMRADSRRLLWPSRRPRWCWACRRQMPPLVKYDGCCSPACARAANQREMAS